jgi:hypothetical protein
VCEPVRYTILPLGSAKYLGFTLLTVKGPLIRDAAGVEAAELYIEVIWGDVSRSAWTYIMFDEWENTSEKRWTIITILPKSLFCAMINFLSR